MFQKIMHFILVGLMSVSVLAGASKKKVSVKEPPIDPRIFILANNQIEVQSYNPKTKAYHLKRPEYPTAETLFATLENVAKSVSTLNLEELRKKPESIVGNVLSTDKDLVLVEDSERAIWKKKGIKNK